MQEKLNDENFMIYAARHYDNPQCYSTEEFYEDLKRIKYIKKLITRYVETGELKERLILNHMIVLSNVFPAEHLSRILYLKASKHMRYLKPFMILLNVLPERIYNVGRESIVLTDEIPMDDRIVNSLRNI